MKKSTTKRMTLSKETLTALEKNSDLEQVLGGAPTQVRSCQTCTSVCSYCTL